MPALQIYWSSPCGLSVPIWHHWSQPFWLPYLLVWQLISCPYGIHFTALMAKPVCLSFVRMTHHLFARLAPLIYSFVKTLLLTHQPSLFSFASCLPASWKRSIFSEASNSFPVWVWQCRTDGSSKFCSTSTLCSSFASLHFLQQIRSSCPSVIACRFCAFPASPRLSRQPILHMHPILHMQHCHHPSATPTTSKDR